MSSLEGYGSTVELHPRVFAAMAYSVPKPSTTALTSLVRSAPHEKVLLLSILVDLKMGGEGFEPSKRAAWQIYSLHPLATWITPRVVRAR